MVECEHLLESLSVKVGPVSERPGHHQRMYVVKRVAKIPGFLQVVDFELNIGWLDTMVIFTVYFLTTRPMVGFLQHYQVLAAVDFLK